MGRDGPVLSKELGGGSADCGPPCGPLGVTAQSPAPQKDPRDGGWSGALLGMGAWAVLVAGPKSPGDAGTCLPLQVWFNLAQGFL